LRRPGQAGRDRADSADWKEIENRSFLWDDFVSNKTLPAQRAVNRLFDILDQLKWSNEAWSAGKRPRPRNPTSPSGLPLGPWQPRRATPADVYFGRPKAGDLEAGKKRLAGDTARAATSDEVKDLRSRKPWRKSSPTSRSKTACSKKAWSGMGETKHEISRIREYRDYPAGRAGRAIAFAGSRAKIRIG
jgi:hypothetical protein